MPTIAILTPFVVFGNSLIDHINYYKNIVLKKKLLAPPNGSAHNKSGWGGDNF
jgi:hypothetical protein